ncbi:MAG: Flp pilus assembly complex ATPase component TadA [Candidatus Omnitrophica bacterium]|nr:Flp pilus assembly complex ATPase component TadA [Candidatus Omnitrophota bacterium]MBU4589779.1 Flp pilus assembly complex ATPase component TadA [Candidatus Omnitrophota bacterium]
MPIKRTILLGERLIQRGLISRRELDKGLKEHEKTGQFLGTTLVKLGFISEEELYPVLAEQLRIEYVKIKELTIDPNVLEKVPARYACHYKLMPVKFDKDILNVAVSDPLDIRLLDDLRLLLGCDVVGLLATESDITEAIRKYYGIGAETIEEIVDTGEMAKDIELSAKKTEDIEDLAEDASIIKFVNQILVQAVKDRVTDIHIEPYEDELKVRYRVDGVLYDIPIPQNIKYFQAAIVSRIKIMASLDIAERRLPQDGRIKIKVGGEELDLRISILPTQFGESVDIRLLSGAMLYSLKNLGLSSYDQKITEGLIKKPHGIIFVTGPTGSGKTTTLYACLSKINNKDKKIITIEDPIEYQLKGVTQIQIHPRIGLSFAAGLRSMLRHDPDIMMVGEVRDFETAEITIRVALTGHLVFSTLHTNDAAGGVARLLDMGVEPYLAASSVECFVAQRLVRLICPNCKVEKKPDKDILKGFGIKEKNINKVTIFEGKGCESCKFTGYRGRTGIYEFLLMHEEIRELVLHRSSADQIKKKALELGMRTLRMDGWEKVKKGLTTIDEIIRVTEED